MGRGGKAAEVLSRVLIILIASGFLIAVPTGGGRAQTKKLEKVAVRISWFANGEEAYWAYGIKKGIFESEGIDLQVLEGSGSAATLRSVGAGADRFGSASAYAAAGLISKGLPVKMIANGVPTIPASVLFFEDKDIKAPKDLEGKKVAFTAGDINHVAFKALAEANKVDVKKVRDVYFDPRGKVTALIAGEVDALAAFYTFSVPTIEARTQKKVKYLRYVDYGVRILGEGIVIPAKYLGEKDLNCRFVRAATRARTEAAKHPDDAIKALLEMFPKAGEFEVQKAVWVALAAIEPSVHAKGKPAGYMAPEDWDGLLNMLKAYGGETEIRPSSTYYTNEFVSCP